MPVVRSYQIAVRPLVPVLLAARLGQVARVVLRADRRRPAAPPSVQRRGDVGGERRVAALVRRDQPPVDPHRRAVVDRAEVQQQRARPARRRRSNVRRYQTTGWKPVSPIPLAGDSGGNGTWIVRSSRSGRCAQPSSRPTSSSSWANRTTSPLRSVQRSRVSCGRGWVSRAAACGMERLLRSGGPQCHSKGQRHPVNPDSSRLADGVPDTPTQHVVARLSSAGPIYGVACSWFGRAIQGGRGKREPGVSPGLPRSGEWERPPSSSTGPSGPGKRRPVGRPRTAVPCPRVRRPASAPRATACAVGPRPRGTADGIDASGRRAAARGVLRVPVGRRRAREERAMTVTQDRSRRRPTTNDRTSAPARRCRCASATATPSRSTSTRSSARSSAGPPTSTTSTRCGSRPRRSAACTTARPRAELDRLSIQTAAELIGEEPQYSRLAARLLAAYIDKEVRGQGIASFSQSIALRPRRWADRRRHRRVRGRPTRASSTTPSTRDGDLRFEYFGLRTVYDRYLLRHPQTRLVIETPQYFLLRVACGLSHDAGRGDRASTG